MGQIRRSNIAPLSVITPDTVARHPADPPPPPHWTRERLAEIPDRDLAAVLEHRALAEPLKIHRFGRGMRRPAFASTLRGTVVLSGGKRAAKSFVGGAFVAALADGLHPWLACPPTCVNWGIGSCSEHCCPQPKWGAADYRAQGCTAGANPPRTCPVHRPLYYPPGEDSRLILVGTIDRPKFWSALYNRVLSKLLSRNDDGSQPWICRPQENAIICPGKWRIQNIPYDEVRAWESYDPCAILLDEFPRWEILEAAQDRRRSRNVRLFVTATALKLEHGGDMWVVTELAQKTAIPAAKTQVLTIDTRDNDFLEPDALQGVKEDYDYFVSIGREQHARIVIAGDLEAVQDKGVFPRTTIKAQEPFILQPKMHYVVPSGLTGQDASWLDYFANATRFPPSCVLSGDDRNQLIAARDLLGHGGVACVDCPTRCPQYQPPPRPAHMMGDDALPKMVSEKPAGAVEAYPVQVWEDPIPGHIYAIGGDTSKGRPGGDPACIPVGDVITGRQVAMFYEHARPDKFEAVMYALWRRYNRAFIVSETNTYGYMVLVNLMERYGIPPQCVFARWDKTRRKTSGAMVAEFGFETTRGTKSLGSSLETSVIPGVAPPLRTYADMLATRRLIIRAAIAWQELCTFVRSPEGKLEALPGAHDDTVIALSLMALGMAIQERKGAVEEATEVPAQVVALRHPGLVTSLDDLDTPEWSDEPWNRKRQWA